MVQNPYERGPVLGQVGDPAMTAAALETSPRTAVLHRMVTDQHICPWGLRAKDLLRRRGYAVEDHLLTTREEIDVFKAAHGVKTTPQTFIDGQRIGGYDDLRRHFGLRVRDPKALTYTPVIAVFAVAALMALAVNYTTTGQALNLHTVQVFIAISMCVLGVLKLRDVETFSTMFLGYDLLARRWPRYGWIYPFAEVGAGVLMLAGILTWLSAPAAMFIGGVGAVSVF